MYITVFDGVRFIEGRPEILETLGPVEVRLDGILSSSQLKNLDDVKREMAVLVHAMGGNSVVDFKYGQRSVGFLASIFQRDDVAWYGTGMAARIP